MPRCKLTAVCILLKEPFGEKESDCSNQICFANQLTGFYMRATLAFNGLMILCKVSSKNDESKHAVTGLKSLLDIYYRFFLTLWTLGNIKGIIEIIPK